MENTKKASETIAVLSSEQQVKLNELGLAIYNSSDNIQKDYDETFDILKENETSLEHFNAVKFHWLEGIIEKGRKDKRYSQGYANTLWGNFMAYARDMHDYKKPQSQKAVLEAERREKVKAVLSEKYGNMSSQDLKTQLLETDDAKTITEITKVIAERNKEVKKAEADSNSEYLKNAKAVIADLLKSKNENAVSNAMKIMAFIKKENLK